jgi:hypothetical protein
VPLRVVEDFAVILSAGLSRVIVLPRTLMLWIAPQSMFSDWFMKISSPYFAWSGDILKKQGDTLSVLLSPAGLMKSQERIKHVKLETNAAQ